MSSAPVPELGDWLRLTLTPGVGAESQRALLKAFGSAQAIFAANAAELVVVGGELLAKRLRTADRASIEASVAQTLIWAEEPGNAILTLGDEAYPQALLDTADPPTLLYVKGRAELLNAPMLAIVGSRNATAQGERDAQAFAAHLAASGLTIVSGLALGIDAAAHLGALETVAGTVAVIGTGADRLYPARNAELARQIAQRGVVVSEFPLGTPALASNFPRRNRIIAGLAKGTLVVEAAPRSGSLITARLAAEAGREVFAIPGSIHAPQSRGCHQLIRQGAKLVETAQDILEELRWEVPLNRSAGSEPGTATGPADTGHMNAVLGLQGEHVLTALGHAPCDLDSLLQRTSLTSSELLAILLTLELAGRVSQLPGGLYQQLQHM